MGNPSTINLGLSMQNAGELAPGDTAANVNTIMNPTLAANAAGDVAYNPATMTFNLTPKGAYAAATAPPAVGTPGASGTILGMSYAEVGLGAAALAALAFVARKHFKL